MSVSFFGWEVSYDDDSPLELTAAQEPRDGRTYTMYHGTSVATARAIIANGFVASADGMLGPGVYTSRAQKKAERYPLNAPVTDRVVLQLRVDAGRVKRIDTDNHPMQKSWHASGYDTAWVPPNCGMRSVPSGLEEDCVFDPKRVQVTGVALAPDTATLAELQRLIAGRMGVAAAQGACAVCKRKTAPGQTHALQPCWGCGQKICTLMVQHVCPARG